MEKSRQTKFIAGYLIIALICVGAYGLYLFATPDGWISAEPSGYTLSSPPPTNVAILIPTVQDYQQYPHLKALLEHPRGELPVSNNPFVWLRYGESVMSGKEAGGLGIYGLSREGYILNQDRCYNVMLVVT